MAEQQNFLSWLQSLDRPRPGFRRTRRPSQIPSVLSAGHIRVVYQPIVELRGYAKASGAEVGGSTARGSTARGGRFQKTSQEEKLRGRGIFAYEALVRSDSPHFESPPALFTAAIRGQCCGALGRVIREIATSNCPDYPLFINIHPNEFDEAWLVQPDDPIFEHYHNIYLEITESVPLSHFALCHSVLREIRGKGVHVAIDDLGAGYSNLKYIADLEPDVVKLDRSLVANVHCEKRLQMLVRHMVRLCDDLGALVVAEGVETRDELAAVIDCGAHLGQGYYFAKPSFPPPMPK